MAKKAFVYDGTNWIDIAQSTVDLSNYANLTTTPISGFRNAIINGDFRVWQRGTSSAMATGAGSGYLADRWAAARAAYASGGTVSRQSSGLSGFQFCSRVQRNSGNTSTAIVYYYQTLETSASIPFANSTASYSFYIRAGANFSGSIVANLFSGTATDQQNFPDAAITGVQTVVTSTLSLTTSWQRVTLSGTVSASATQLFAGFTWTPSGTAGAADYFEITGVQVERGSTATPFENRPIGTELALCQRYFWRHAPTGITYLSFVYAGSQYRITLPNPVEMRVVPTSVTSSGWAGGTTPTLGAANKHAVNFISVAGNYYIDNGTIIDVSAEL